MGATAVTSDITADMARNADGDDVKVRASNVIKTYPGKDGLVTALKGVSVEIPQGEMAVLLGPSGCGKTTLLRSIAGLERPEGGEISVSGRTVYSSDHKVYLPPERRAVSMVFQSYALWPHMTVAQNIGYPLACRKVAKAQIAERVQQMMDAVHLGKYGHRYPNQLSGGQQQRVALARAIIADADVILFDEPLSNVDARVREEIRKQIIALQAEFNFAGIYVTHDQVEAGAIATKLIVMNHGEIAQVGRPQELYDNPVSRYVASFMGTTTEVSGTATSIDGMVALDTAVGRVIGKPTSAIVDGDRAVGVFRPEWGHVVHEHPGADHNVWPCVVKLKSFMGAHMEVVVELRTSSGAPVEATVAAPRGSGLREGQCYYLHVPSADLCVLPEGEQ
ncbi:ABC transporter ATP-binding protein [Aeromicrobium phragmitis]|uniref:ABC transporter ATP-binding protein n=1 Tax=Aeromicrobium phragmitis TaxID=2478914 RepID=A0A3L8PIR1_9ACTN|nr:ABC transporter ATP-binding protein [Aeromicrobium phragmitis]RLV54553.1 ABC transporter ATP-binding protein [Aeromicrobium phragmitis]